VIMVWAQSNLHIVHFCIVCVALFLTVKHPSP
jgi:hypothetical protein